MEMDDPLILEALDRLDSARLPGAVERLLMASGSQDP